MHLLQPVERMHEAVPTARNIRFQRCDERAAALPERTESVRAVTMMERQSKVKCDRVHLTLGHPPEGNDAGGETLNRLFGVWGKSHCSLDIALLQVHQNGLGDVV